MIFDKFEMHAIPIIRNAYCECGGILRVVSNGLMSEVLYCPKCKNIYRLQIRKVPRKQVSKSFIEQCKKEIGKELK